MKKTRKLFTILIGLMLTVVLAVTNLTVSAFAANSTWSSKQGAESPSVPAKELYVGETLFEADLPGITHIRTPRGVLEEIDSEKGYTFAETGYYSFAIVDNDVIRYEGFRKEVTADEEKVTLSIAKAGIPTKVKTGVAITGLPTATLLDKDGNVLKNAADYDFTYTYTTPAGNAPVSVTPVTADGKSSWSIPEGSVAEEGKYGITISAKKKSNGVVLFEQFTILAQASFEDKTAPTITVSGFPNYQNIRSKVTLPAAKAEDNHDRELLYTVVVKAPEDKPIYKMKKFGKEIFYVDADGKKIDYEDAANRKVAEADESKRVLEVFDNDKNMSFYPEYLGTYTVQYTATDDSGNEVKTSRTFSGDDQKGPELDIPEEDLLPDTLEGLRWGKTVTNHAGTRLDSFVIPAAYATDNVAIKPDSVREVTVDGIKKSAAHIKIEKDGATIYDSADSEKPESFVTKNNDGSYSVNINEYKAEDISGLYTVTYSAKDERNPATTKVKRFTISYDVKYKAEPIITFKGLPDFLEVGAEFKGFTVGTEININSQNEISGAEPKFFKAVSKVAYSFKSADAPAGADFKPIDPENEDDFKFEEGGTLKITVTAKDAYQNVAEEMTKEIDVVNFLSGKKVNFGFVANEATAEKGKTYNFLKNATSTVIEAADAGSNKYLGFETYMYYSKSADFKNARISDFETTTTYYKDKVSGAIKIESITFKPTVTGFFTLVLRGYDQGAFGVVKTATVEVKNAGAPQGAPNFSGRQLLADSSSVDSSEVDLNEPKHLRFSEYEEGCDYIKIKAIGTHYSVTGERFVPMDSEKTYAFEFAQMTNGNVVATKYANYRSNAGKEVDHPFQKSALDYTLKHPTDADKNFQTFYYQHRVKFADKGFEKALEDADKAIADAKKVSNNDAIIAIKVWERDKLLAEKLMPIPQLSINYKPGSLTEYEVKVFEPKKRDGGGKEIFNIETDSKGQQYFRNSVDGTYTIKYKAVFGVFGITSGETTNFKTILEEVSVDSGDVTLPSIKNVSALTPSGATVGDKFTFKEFEATDLVTVDSTKLTYRRVLLLDGKEVYGDAIRTVDNKGYVLAKSGTYTVHYIATDEAGNEKVEPFEFTVAGKGPGAVNYKIISTVLIVVACLLIVGLLIYFFAFRKVDLTKKKKLSTEKASDKKTAAKKSK